MKGNRGLSILAGLIEGGILGMWLYSLMGVMLAYGPIWSSGETVIPAEVMRAFLADCLKFGVLPGLVVGLIAGAVLPFLIPRGHMAKSIGAPLFFILAPLAWVTQWHNIAAMTGGKITQAVVVTIVVFFATIPVSGWIGEFVERIRE